MSIWSILANAASATVDAMGQTVFGILVSSATAIVFLIKLIQLASRRRKRGDQLMMPRDIRFLSRVMWKYVLVIMPITAVVLLFMLQIVISSYTAGVASIKPDIDRLAIKVDALKVVLSEKPDIEILWDGSPLNGKVIELAKDGDGSFQLMPFEFRNKGRGVTSHLELQLFLSREVGIQNGFLGTNQAWEHAGIKEPNFAVSYLWDSDKPISPEQTWVGPALWGRLEEDFSQKIKRPLGIRLKAFYGGSIPAVADFTIRTN